MENVLFTVSVDNTLSVWAPINPWEPHVLYQRASISLDPSKMTENLQTPVYPTMFCILLDSGEVTRALETVFNKMNGTDPAGSSHLSQLADIARKNPEICLVLNPEDDSLCVWGIDVCTLKQNCTSELIREASGLQKWESAECFQDTRKSFTQRLGK